VAEVEVWQATIKDKKYLLSLPLQEAVYGNKKRWSGSNWKIFPDKFWWLYWKCSSSAFQPSVIYAGEGETTLKAATLR